MTNQGRARITAASLAVVWLLATALLIGRNSLWTPVATAGLAVSAAALWWRNRQESEAPAPFEPWLPLSPPLAQPPWRPLLKLALAGALINAAMLSEGRRNSVAAGLFLAAAVGIILTRISGPERECLAVRHRWLSLALALLLSVGGLIRWSVRRWQPMVDDNTPPAESAARANRRKDDVSFRGVILYVVRPPEKVTPPTPLALRAGAADPNREPLVIPFSGVYWFMRAPDRLPPAASLVQHGSPDQLFYRAADVRPMVMEAHQHLGRHVDIECCSGLDLDLVNVDRYPGSVFVEVILDDTTSAGPRLSLGLQPVESTVLRLYGERVPREETLRYQISRGRFGRFDEITVRFHLSGIRNRQSARMAIQRFTLRPRGA